ncbi:MAG: glycogen synthase [Erysipelotrichaceae bacterium]
MRVLFVASEGLPYIKSGGLADVIGSLPHNLSNDQTSVEIIMPLYQKIIDKYLAKLEYVFTIEINQGIFRTNARIFQHNNNGVVTYFVENQEYFERSQLYGYGDDGARFAFFQHAVMNFILQQKNNYDIIHCHDWHSGMIAVLGKTLYQWHDKIKNLKYVYTIHNLAFQGNFPTSVLTDCFGLTLDLMADNSVNFHDGMSFMKGGIFYSDKVTTVSETYANEILTKEFGEQMDYVLDLKRADLIGIVNGIDIKLWNPNTDKALAYKYSKNSLVNKAKNKLALQCEYGLSNNKDVPMIALVSRLTDQKGLQLIVDKIEDLLKLNLQLFFLGSGDSKYEDIFKYLEGKYDNFVFYRGYNEILAHQIYAASDFFLMPSYFEPCGISQLIAMRYGSLPIVRETGGLKDTVSPYNKYELSGEGFTFSNFDSTEMYYAIIRALELFVDNNIYQRIQINAMSKRVSWNQSAKKYRQLYQSIIKS